MPFYENLCTEVLISRPEAHAVLHDSRLARALVLMVLLKLSI